MLSRFRDINVARNRFVRGLLDRENGSQKSGLVLFSYDQERIEEQRIKAVIAWERFEVLSVEPELLQSPCATESPKTRPGGRPYGRHSEYQIFHGRQGRR